MRYDRSYRAEQNLKCIFFSGATWYKKVCPKFSVFCVLNF